MSNRSNARRCVALTLTLSLAAIGCGNDDDDGAKAPELGPQDPTKVTIADGKLEGDVIGGSIRFLKIPYAKPPVGALRWKAPQDNEPWSGVRHETDFASPCPQPPSQQSPASTDEDCLYLNVWRPNGAATKAPVMVWIHGGGFTTGSAADKVPSRPTSLYPGILCRTGVVLVSINYRGASSDSLPTRLSRARARRSATRLLDQRLHCGVQKNIEAFGGDPGNVTISANRREPARCVCTPFRQAAGLFHRAVIQSGGCTLSAATDRAALNAQIDSLWADRGCSGAAALDVYAAKRTDLVSMETVDRTMVWPGSGAPFLSAGRRREQGFCRAAIALFDRARWTVPYILAPHTRHSCTTRSIRPCRRAKTSTKPARGALRRLRTTRSSDVSGIQVRATIEKPSARSDRLGLSRNARPPLAAPSSRSPGTCTTHIREHLRSCSGSATLGDQHVFGSPYKRVKRTSRSQTR